MPKKGCTRRAIEKPFSIPQPRGSPQEKHFQNNIPGQELLHALASIRLDPKYSDLTITCGDDHYAVHKCIVCTRSGFFDRACNGGFKESFINTVNLQEEPALVERMVDYLYTLDYEVHDFLLESDHDVCEGTSTADDCERAVTSAKTYSSLNSDNEAQMESSDRLLIEGLKVLSKDKVERALVQRLDASTFQKAVVEIYNSTPASDRGLRDLVVKITLKHLTKLREIEEGAPLVFPNSLVISVPQFSSDLLIAMMDQTTSGRNQ